MITSWNASDLAQITNGTWHNTMPTAPLDSIDIDHRQMDDTGLFVALGGTMHDGHDFLGALSASHSALVQQADEKSAASQLCVSDSLQALHDLAKAAMAQTSAHKIAITGSVGKTSTKDALARVLSCYGECHASRGNYNNHIGAPLSMARTPDKAEMIVMEMGMNHAGEIAPLSHLFAGDIAIITKIADSHIGHFDNLEQIAHAKAEIFDGMTGGTAILPYDDAHFNLLSEKARKCGLDITSFGHNETADIQLVDQSSALDGQMLTIKNNETGEMISLRSGLCAPHHATTIMIVLCVLHKLGLSWQKATSAIAQLQEVEGRGNRTHITLGGKEVILINDSYNAGPASMAAALSHMADLPPCNKGLILTDMLELGAQTDEAHEALIPLITDIAPHQLALVGEAMGRIAPAITAASHMRHYPDPTACAEALMTQFATCDVILIKGSNGSGAPALAGALLSSDHSPSEMLARAVYVS